jgi:hypothetical protein
MQGAFNMRIGLPFAALCLAVVIAGAGALIAIGWSDHVSRTALSVSDETVLTWPELSSKLRAAIADAEAAAQERARTELDKWLGQVIARAEGQFLDWHFSYFSGRLRDISWTWDRLWSGREHADQTYLAEIESKFFELVLTPDQAVADFARVAETAGQEFQARLGVRLSMLRRELSMEKASFDAMLSDVRTSVFDSNGARHNVNLQEIAEGSRLVMHGIRWASEQLQRKPPLSIQQASLILGAAPVPIAAAGTGATTKVVTANLVAAGATIAAVVVVAVAVGYEWYSHSKYVNENRPRVREEVARSIREFSEHALTNTGYIGIGLYSTKTAIVEAIRAQESLWGRIKLRLQIL